MGLYKITANKRFNYSKNVKNIRRREKKKERNQKKLALLTEEAKIIHKHWDHSKGMKSNMSALGLSMDPNKTIKIDKARYAKSYCTLISKFVKFKLILFITSRADFGNTFTNNFKREVGNFLDKISCYILSRKFPSSC